MSTALEVLTKAGDAIDRERNRHLCVNTLVPHVPWLDGDCSSLLRCTRCRGVYYSNPEGQKKNWSAHKLTCKAPNADYVGNLSLLEAWIITKDQLTRGSPDENIALLLKHMRRQFESHAEDEEHKVEMDMHTIARNLIFMPDDPRMRQFHLQLWSAPGVADWFYYEEDLITDKVRKQRAVFKHGMPSEEGIRHVLKIADPVLHDVALRLESEFPEGQDQSLVLSSSSGSTSSSSEGEIQPSGCFRFCYLHFSLLLSCAVVAKPTMNSVHDGYGTLRKGVIAEAAIQRCLQLWLDERVRLSCGDAMSACFSFGLTYIKERKGEASGAEIAPNAPLDEVLFACLQELLEGGDSTAYAIKIIGYISCLPSNNTVWSALSLNRRAKIAIVIADILTVSEGLILDHGGENDGQTAKNLKIDIILNNICGKGTKDDRLKLWRAAAGGRDLCAVGRLDSGRALFHYLLGQYDVPDLLPVMGSAEAAEKQNQVAEEVNKQVLGLDVCKAAIEFGGLPWPFNNSDPRAEDKLESYMQSMEMERFKHFVILLEKAFLSKLGTGKVSGSKYRGKGRPGSSSNAVAQHKGLSAGEIEAKSKEADRIALSLWEEEEIEQMKRERVINQGGGSSSSKGSKKGGKKKKK